MSEKFKKIRKECQNEECRPIIELKVHLWDVEAENKRLREQLKVSDVDRSKIMAIFMRADSNENNDVLIPDKLDTENGTFNADDCFAVLMNYVYKNLNGIGGDK